MSAIWGIVSRSNNDKKEYFDKMTTSMAGYKIDRTDEVIKEEAYFGCAHQYITPEDIADVSPVYDKEKKILFAGDCFIYNREKLVEEIKSTSKIFSENKIEKPQELGDIELAFYAFKAFGYSFVEKLRGVFSFAIYDYSKKQLHLYVDHFVRHYLAFKVEGEAVLFGSVYAPILAGSAEPNKISRHSIANSYHNMSPLSFYQYEMTVFEGIKHLDAAMHFVINVESGAISRQQYWDPIHNVKKLKGLKDEEYKKLFLDTYRSVTERQLRGIHETGIMLSGGLDSSSVLAMAAPVLRARGKKIYSYTTVPSRDFDAKVNYNVIEDESFLIKEQQKMQENLLPRFIGGDEDTCIDYLNPGQALMHLPIKAAVNSSNIDKMSKAAVADNCSILLSGAGGNSTVSYGYGSAYIGLSIEKWHFIRAVKEASAFCRVRKYSKKSYFKDWVNDVWDYLFTTRDMGIRYIQPEDRKKYKLLQIDKNYKRSLGSSFVVTERKKRNFMFIPMQYIQRGLYYTNLGLQYGYLLIDPTLNVEIVELCMSLPNECFVKDGVERRLVNAYMKDLLPAWITDVRKGYGVQSSDFNYRINRDWDKIKDEVYEVLSDPLLKVYLDAAAVDELIEDVRKSEKHFDWNTAWYMVSICSLGYFLRGHKELV